MISLVYSVHRYAQDQPDGTRTLLLAPKVRATDACQATSPLPYTHKPYLWKYLTKNKIQQDSFAFASPDRSETWAMMAMAMTMTTASRTLSRST